MTTRRIKQAIYWGFFLFLSTANADTNNSEQQWYQVEVFVFANNNLNSSNEEQWPTELTLKYPSNYIVLNHNTVATNLETTDELSGTENQLENSNNIPATTQPFRVLAEDQLLLTTQVKKIIQQHDYRSLFHQAWRQQIGDRENAKNIIITGGQQFDSHYELEGSIKLSVERYLHIDTDLWLNQFVSNTGKEQHLWSPLPPLPKSIDDGMADEAITTNNSFSFNQPTLFFSGRNSQLKSEQYTVDQTIVLQQHRRMRSNELHYIDHPLMGLLIKVTPYTPITKGDTIP